VVLGGAAALAGLAGLGAAAYKASPHFFRQYFEELSVPIAPAPGTPKISEWSDKGLYAAWLGHSTVLLKVNGYTILTDPVFSHRAGISLGFVTVGVKRLVDVPVSLEALPPIDLILLSHAHMDHLDKPSLRALESKRTQVVTASHTKDLLRWKRYGKVTELGWGQTAQAGEARVRAFEVNHWGARVRTDTYRGYNGYTVEIGRHKVLFGGDTAYTHTFRDARLGSSDIDLAIMPIGAYNPWIRAHCNPEQAWRMGEDARAHFMLPVHHQTFHLGREPWNEPIDRFVDAAGSRPERIALHRIGQEFRIA
jgi:L-ascorbate metabolism protein UlaG (beta-lactamase superfamily)